MTKPSPDQVTENKLVLQREHAEPARMVASLQRQVAELTTSLDTATAGRLLAENAVQAINREVAIRHDAFRAAELLAHLGSWAWQIDAEYINWSDQVHRIFGTDPNGPPVKQETFIGMVHADDRENVLAVIREAIQNGGSYLVEHRIVRVDGEVRQIRGRGKAELDPATGLPLLLTGSVQDVTDLKTAAAELQRSRDLFAGVLQAATDLAIIATDADGLITVFNSGAEQMLGYTSAEMMGTSPQRLHDQAEIAERAEVLGIPAGFEVFLTTAALGAAETRQWTYITKDGRRLQAMITVAAMFNHERNVTGYIKIGTDVTERMSDQAALQESESRFRDTFEYAPNGMMLVSLDSETPGRLLGVNPAMTQLTGYTEAQLLGMQVSDLTHPEHQEAHWDRFSALVHGSTDERSAERHWIHADGHSLWVQASVSPRRGDRQVYVIGQVEDITARKNAEAALTHQALHDWLTGLPNRLLLIDRVEHALAAATRSGLSVGVLYLDLDGFKAVNDTAGHAAGDQTLVTAADRLSRAVRPGDTVARMGGDEFAVVCVELHDIGEAMNIAQRILTALREPYVFGGHTFTISASVGISLSHLGSHPDQLLREADDAMYGAKEAGKNTIRLGGAQDPTSTSRAARAARSVRIQHELRSALDHDELILYCQPIQQLDTGRIVAVETLIRWQHPTYGILAPAEFLDVAEASDLMVPIGRRVLDESCRMAAAWSAAFGAAAPVVHVNISARQLDTGNLRNDVGASLTRYQLPPERLVLELTETQLPKFADSMRKDLIEMREAGVGVAIDDLGTGYSSLTRITELPVDVLKIDLSFVARMCTDPASDAVVRGILAIGQALGLTVIAEGVETTGQAGKLASYGCDTVQGYLYSRPLPEAEAFDHLGRALTGRVNS